MTASVLTAFALSFFGGPLLCALLLRVRSTLIVLFALATVVVGSMAIALWVETGAPLLSLALMWVGWVSACAMVGHAFLRRLAGPRIRRWITVVTILATTLPWFGLATARLMG
ncbi:hypothetical protein J4E08_19000 [Sagittula sp. NFXS13]|uniref:hypothetical protein n=1 Tax=Sagittula sp. NFXS13 TaxID=2819095 RepID=UPI0032DF5391